MESEYIELVYDLIDLGKFTREECGEELQRYHFDHCEKLMKYGNDIMVRLGILEYRNELEIVAYAHDLFKRYSLRENDVEWNGKIIPQNIPKYIDENRFVLDKFGLNMIRSDNFSNHPIAAGIFLYKEFTVDDPKIIYPVFFHSCPIISIYKKLDKALRNFIDVILLADKMSANVLCRGIKKWHSKVDMELVLYGENHKEFNYTNALLTAKILGQCGSKDKFSVESTKHYYKRAARINPALDKNSILLGRKKPWKFNKAIFCKMQKWIKRLVKKLVG